ncbi:MAG TPA: 50S ribosomal protein L24 [Firmicutes bacterium]|nr:50S ribosomal protein L24 [Bacillota bacterium]HBK68801.1 50S ribosomal protein L24 [Bacillota bacterium]HBT17914.1 50S ribosomal protein L24 [Bacillota bacterium]
MGLKTFLRKGDEVIVLSGKDKDKRGKIQRVLRSKGMVIVEGVNLVKKHARPTKNNPQGGVIDKAMPLNAAKVMLVCNGCGQPARIGRDRTPDGSLVRICKKCGHNYD